MSDYLTLTLVAVILFLLLLVLYSFLIRPNSQQKKHKREALETSREAQDSVVNEQPVTSITHPDEPVTAYEKQELSYCPFCGTPLIKRQIFCELCGCRVNQFYQKEPEPPQPVVGVVTCSRCGDTIPVAPSARCKCGKISF